MINTLKMPYLSYKNKWNGFYYAQYSNQNFFQRKHANKVQNFHPYISLNFQQSFFFLNYEKNIYIFKSFIKKQIYTFYPSLLIFSVFDNILYVSLIAPSSISSGHSGGHKTLAPMNDLYIWGVSLFSSFCYAV